MEQNTTSIKEALKKVLGLFSINDIEVEVEVLLPQSYGEIGKLIENKENNGKRSIVVYFDFLENELKEKWDLDTYRFWCGFFQGLGIGYEGSDVSRLVTQLLAPDLKGDKNGKK
ncbi:MAG: hypothetical protein HY279_09460 [Nitrospinae bacterium]|nr:hypothetical protein [Nitrospinota bacterium]